MKRYILTILALSSISYSFAVDTGINDNWQDDYSKLKIVTASSIESLNKDVSSITPAAN